MRASTICVCAWGLLIVAMQPVSAAVTLSEKHLIILRAGLDSVWGDYIFSVQNNQQTPQPAVIALFLPHETVDFKAIEGVTAADLRVDTQNGAVMLQKEFATGVSLVNIGFKVMANAGQASLSWTARQHLASVNIMYEHEIMQVFSETLVATQLPRIAEVQYQALRSVESLQAGASLQVQVRGIPQGRAQLHLFAVAFAVILLVSTVWLGIKTRPRDADMGKQNAP